jgi:hypothetical protein
MDLRNNLCRNFCFYYKPSIKEELACGGFLVVERLIRKAKQLSFEKSEKKIDLQTEEKLLKTLCPVCPFFEGDCDFILKEGDARPCGGFILLGQLIDRGLMSIDDVRNIE